MLTENLPLDFNFNNYLFSFDKEKIDADAVYKYLSEESYWAKNIPLDTVLRSIEHSICLGIYDVNNTLVGFGRIITDQATFAYLADVFILEAHRGKGLSKKMVEAFCHLADQFGLRRMMLATQDAHGLYKQFGFEQLTNPETIMNRKGAAY